MVLTRGTANVPDQLSADTRAGGVKNSWLIFTLLGFTMSQKYSVTEIANLVPRAPTPDTHVKPQTHAQLKVDS